MLWLFCSLVRQSRQPGAAASVPDCMATKSAAGLTSVWNLSSIKRFCSSCWLRGFTSWPASTAGQGSPCIILVTEQVIALGR